jgi:hypothetical protein
MFLCYVLNFCLKVRGLIPGELPEKLFNKSDIKKVRKKSYLLLDKDIFLAYIGKDEVDILPWLKS